MNLNRPFPYNSSYKIHILIGIFLGLILGFILIVLQPFNLNNFNHNNGSILLMGFGFIKCITYISAHFIENYFYKKNGYWTLWNEIIFLLSSSLLGAILAYIYLDLVFEKQPLSFLRSIRFFYYIILPILPLVIFPKSVFRYLIIKNDTTNIISENSKKENPVLDKITLKGQNIKDELTFIKDQLIYVKSLDNYVMVYYYDQELKSKMLRAKLSEILIQAPFLIQPHRSYLINPKHSFKVKGNSQKATLVLLDIEEDIPISRISYKTIKTLFN